MMETVYSKLKVGNLLYLRKVMLSHDAYQKVNTSIVFRGAMNNFNEMFPLAKIFPLAVMHRGRWGEGTKNLNFKGMYLCMTPMVF